MENALYENNRAYLSGVVHTAPVFSHEVYGEGFFSFELEVNRLSEQKDIIPVTISERLTADALIEPGSMLGVNGQIRSYNKFIDGKSRLLLTVFARDISNEPDELANPNQIILDGHLCKPPVYRTTPFNREISDLLLAVNRAYGKSDYIPCIAWGRNARFCERMSVGDKIRIWGRLQSRDYQKRTQEGEVLNKVAYEVSVSKLYTYNNLHGEFEQEPIFEKAE